MQIVKKLFYLLSSPEKKSAGILFIMISFMALIDMLGVASIMPFMAVLTNPTIIETNSILNSLYISSQKIGIKSRPDFIYALGIFVFFFLVFSLLFKSITIYFQLHFTQMREYTISKRLIEGYLRQPYSWFLNHNSANLGKSILSEVGFIVGNGLMPMINLLTHTLIVIFILTLLIFVNFKLTFLVAFILGGTYLIIYKISVSFLKQIGKERFKANEKRFKLINEVFGAIKEVKVGGLENIFINKFSVPAKIYAKRQATSYVIGQIPRYIIEAIAFGGILLMTLYMAVNNGGFVEAIPIISLFALAGYRLIPSLQQIYASASQLKFSNSAINSLYEDLKSLKTEKLVLDKSSIDFRKGIYLKNINYNYFNSSKKALNNISLTIPTKTSVGIIGPTGCGKTTVLNIILGLLKPQSGTLKVDDQKITKNNIRMWQQLIGYVPQHIYLSDDTISANIAFGVDKENIKMDLVKKVSKIANLHSFINEELPNKYQTEVGERGVRLSGGQRQRIGIARALYYQPKIIIFDEATSALDNKTENEVISSIEKIDQDLTVIMVAHRLTTLKNCKKIFKLENGNLIKEGRYEDLIDDKITINKV